MNERQEAWNKWVVMAPKNKLTELKEKDNE
jgi:hypothetical protein